MTRVETGRATGASLSKGRSEHLGCDIKEGMYNFRIFLFAFARKLILAHYYWWCHANTSIMDWEKKGKGS